MYRSTSWMVVIGEMIFRVGQFPEFQERVKGVFCTRNHHTVDLSTGFLGCDEGCVRHGPVLSDSCGASGSPGTAISSPLHRATMPFNEESGP